MVFILKYIPTADWKNIIPVHELETAVALGCQQLWHLSGGRGETMVYSSLPPWLVCTVLQPEDTALVTLGQIRNPFPTGESLDGKSQETANYVCSKRRTLSPRKLIKVSLNLRIKRTLPKFTKRQYKNCSIGQEFLDRLFIYSSFNISQIGTCFHSDNSFLVRYK